MPEKNYKTASSPKKAKAKVFDNPVLKKPVVLKDLIKGIQDIQIISPRGKLNLDNVDDIDRFDCSHEMEMVATENVSSEEVYDEDKQLEMSLKTITKFNEGLDEYHKIALKISDSEQDELYKTVGSELLAAQDY